MFVFNTDMFQQYAQEDVRLTIQHIRYTMNNVFGSHTIEEEKKSKHDWKQYFRVEPFKRQGKGTVYRVVRIRDELEVLRLVKNETKAIRAAIKMLDDEVRIVERIVERTILG